jgi:hypothetical protein
MMDNAPIKICTKCHTEFPATVKYFYKRGGGRNGLSSVCRKCDDEYHRQWRKKHRKINVIYRMQCIEHCRQYREKNRDKINEQQRQHRKIYRKEVLDKRRQRNLNKKLQVINHYGGKCAICGELDPDLLTIDHINNDGAKHRREIGIKNGNELYCWLIKNNFPPGFQVLCWNHNAKKGFEYRRSKCLG